jgi:MFS family permease
MFKGVNKNVRYYLAANSFYYAGADLVKAFLAVLITQNITDGKAEAIGFVIAYTMIIRAVMEIPITKLTKNLPPLTKIQLVSACIVIYGVLIALLGFSTQLWHIFLIETLIGIVEATTYPLKWAIFSNNLDEGNEETEWSLEDVISVSAIAVSAFMAGLLVDRVGINLLFVLMGMLFTFSGIVFHFIKVKKTLKMKIKDVIFSNMHFRVLD